MTTTLFPSVPNLARVGDFNPEDTQISPLELTVIPLGFNGSDTTRINNDPDLDRLAKLCRMDTGMHRKGATVY